MKLEHGWISSARKVPSPYFNQRLDNERPSLLIIHNISLPLGEFGGPWIDRLFTGTLPRPMPILILPISRSYAWRRTA